MASKACPRQSPGVLQYISSWLGNQFSEASRLHIISIPARMVAVLNAREPERVSHRRLNPGLVPFRSDPFESFGRCQFFVLLTLEIYFLTCVNDATTRQGLRQL